MNGKQKRVQTMAQLTSRSKDYDKFTRELQLALQREVSRRQQAGHSEHENEERTEFPRPLECEDQPKTALVAVGQKHEEGATEEKKPMKKSILRKIEIFLNPALLSKTSVCKHDHGCFENVMRRALKNFLIGFGIQLLLKNITMIAKPAKLMQRLLKGHGLRESANFGLFVMCFNTLYKLTLCVMRRLGCLDDRKNAPVAGFVSALSLMIDVKNRRQLLTVLTLSRALDTALYAAESKAKAAAPEDPAKQGVFRPDSFLMRHKVFILWLIANTFLQSAMGLKPDILNRGMEKFFHTWSQQTKNDIILKETWIKMLAGGAPNF